MKHLNPECSLVEIGTGNCPKCNPDKECSCNVGIPKVQKQFFICPKHGEQNKDKNQVCAKCGEEYTSYRDGYCQDCEIEEEGKPFAYFDRVLATPKFVAVKKTKSKRVTPFNRKRI